jgi:splicing factor 3B subunit 2
VCERHSAQWGFHPGGWGKPPLDEYNRPLYGDVFGVLPKANDTDVRFLTISSGLY